MSISDKPNTIISIGWLGDKTCYLNVPEEEAIRRWKEANPDQEVHGLEIKQVGDEWHSYDGAW